MTIDQEISNFIRDAQYRIAEIGESLSNMKDEDSQEYANLKDIREQLYLFMDCLYVSYQDIIDGYNFLDADWTDYFIKQEMEYLRRESGMINSPFDTYLILYNEIVIGGAVVEGGANLPIGTANQFVGYDASGNPVAQNFPTKVGMNTTETAAAYFSGASALRIKDIENPTLPLAEMDALDPILKKGQIVFVLEPDYSVRRFKTGNGINAWSELEFMGIDEYPYTDLVTNPIGDLKVGDSLFERSTVDILRDALSPYKVPAITLLKNNAKGTFQSTTQFEVGQSFSSAVSLTFSVDDANNLIDGDSIEVLAPEFVVSNPYPNQTINITPVSALTPSTPITYTIQVRGIHDQGNTPYSSTTIKFDGKIIWGASALSDLTSNAQALALIGQGGGSIVSSDPKRTYNINSVGYGFVLIPGFVTTAGLVWTEVSDPNAPASLTMVNMGTISLNNGIGTYNYTKFRTPFNNTSAIKLKAS